MKTIPGNLGNGGGGLSSDAGTASVRELLEAAVDELTEIRAKYAALLTKLDLDAGVTDTDYTSTLTLASPALAKS